MKQFLKACSFLAILISIGYSGPEINTLFSTQVGPGIYHKQMVAPFYPWNIHILEIDLKNPYLQMESIKAKDAYLGYETTSSMSKRSSQNGHRVVGAVNGDFYGSGGIPINTQVINGQILKNPNGLSTLGFDGFNHPVISRLSFSGTVKTENAETGITAINATRGENNLIVYNSFMGKTSGTNQWGDEYLITPLKPWSVNDTILCTVDSMEHFVGNMPIPDGKAVLSAHGSAMTFFQDHVSKNDTIKLVLNLAPSLPGIKEVVGAFPKIVNDGKNYTQQGFDEEGGPPHTFQYHPRTAAGFSADSSKLYLITVDGRQTGFSRGMNLTELADFMISIGVAYGVNFDGGGSTTMVVHDQVKNSPSDGAERSVANALMVVSTAPSGALSHVQIQPDNCRLFRGESVQFKTSGWDEYYNPATIDPSGLSYEVDEALGTVNENGFFTATENGGDGYVYCTLNGLRDSAYIHIKAINSITINPDYCVIDTIQSLPFDVIAIDEDGLKQTMAPNNFDWMVLDPAIVEIDTNGVVNGLQEGTTRVVVQYAALSDTAEVSVEIGSEETQLDIMDDLSRWALSGENIDTLACTIALIDTPRSAGEKAFRVDYQFTRLSTERSLIYLDTDIPVYGVPEFIEFDIKSDGYKHRAYVIASDNNDEWFKSTVSGYAQETTRYDTMTAKTASFRTMGTSGTFNFPIRIRSLWVKLGTSANIGETNKGTLYFDNLRIRYPQVTSIVPISNTALPNSLKLYQNYPNPFNPTTTINFETTKNGPVILTVYDLLGKEVARLVEGDLNAGWHNVSWNAAQHASGMYIYRLESAGQSLSRKLLLMK